jgi:hypothetical protein
MTIVQAPFFQNQPTGQIIYTEVGTYTFTVPDDVFFLGAVCVGGGGGGARDNNNAETGGGGGGGLRFTQYLPVNPGEILTIVVGSGGPGATANGSGTAGGNTTISRGGTTLLQANGGGAGTQTVGGTGGTGTTIEGIIGGGDGGNGGNESGDFDGGGGGAGGYSGNGGAGGVDVTNGETGTGGGGGGGGSGGTGGGGGGGVNLFGGDGTLNGSGGNSGIVGNIGGVGNGGSEGSSGSGLVGGLYGGGGGGNDGASGGNGADGAARIIWGPNRSFPNNRTTDIFTGSILSYDVSFASSNATTDGSITVPSIANGDLYLFIVYENDTVNRPTITGFNIILSDNGTFDGAACTRVLLKGKATPGSTITIPNDATFNGFAVALIGFTNGTNLGQTIFQAGVANVSFSSITNGYYIMMANHDGLTEAYDTYDLDADFTRTFTYLTANGAVTGRSAAIGVVEPVVQSGTITPSRPAVGATVQTQGTQFCFLYID